MKNQPSRRTVLEVAILSAPLLLLLSTRPGIAQHVGLQPVAGDTQTRLIEALAAAKLDPAGVAVINPDLEAAMRAAFEQAMDANTHPEPDRVIDETMQGVRRQLEDELRELAQVVQAQEAARSNLRQAIMEVREAISEGSFPAGVTYAGPDGNEVTQSVADEGEAEALLDVLGSSLSDLSDLLEMNTLSLQQARQRYNQVIQVISSMMKNQHDTLKAIINNIK